MDFIGIPHGLSGAALKQSLKDRIHLGLDLKGGTRLVLKVHVEDAVNSGTKMPNVERIQDDLAKISVTGEQVKKVDPVGKPGVITISGVPANRVGDVRGALQSNDYATYGLSTNADGSMTLTLTAGAVRDIETHALEQSIETIQDRVNALGVAETSVQQYGLGDNQIVVELPGVSDPQQVDDAIHSTAKLAVYAVVPGQGPWESDQEAMTALGGNGASGSDAAARCMHAQHGQVCLLYRRKRGGGHGLPRRPAFDGPERPAEHDLHADDGRGRPVPKVHQRARGERARAGADCDCAGQPGEGGRGD